MEILLGYQNIDKDKDKLSQLSNVLSDAFEQDPIMSSIFRNKGEIRKFMFFMLKYFDKFGEIHYTKDLSGVALWLKPGVDFISVKTIFSKGMFKDVLRLFFSVSIFSLIRLFSISDFLSRQKPLVNHYYLFAIGSNRKGKGIGKYLMSFAVNRFGNKYGYYLENTNVVNNSFYQKFGFKVNEKAKYKENNFYLMSREAPFNEDIKKNKTPKFLFKNTA